MDFDLIPWEDYCPLCGYTILDDEIIEPFILCIACGGTTVEEEDPYELDAIAYAEKKLIEEEEKDKPIPRERKKKIPYETYVNDYRKYIDSPQWKQKAIEAKRRAGWRCQVCNAPESSTLLNAHHRTYDRLGDERQEDITVLCKDCHKLFHDNGKISKL